MGFVFLSYAGTDRNKALQIKQGLSAAGLDVWMDVERIQLADNWIEKLQDAITNCAAYVILIGSAGVKRWVTLELNVALNRNAESNDQFPICPLLLPDVTPNDLPPFLAMFQAVRLPAATHPEDFERIAKQIDERITKNQPQLMDNETVSDRCPFPGLEAYDEEIAEYFFGRRSETLDAMALLGCTHDGIYRPWLQIEGPSGVGKSSLVKAGIIPTIRRGWIEERGDQPPRQWRIGIMRPGSDPVYNLAETLVRAFEKSSGGLSLSELKALLRVSGIDALRDFIRQHIPANERFLLVVDQLEEVFTLAQDTKGRECFDNLIASALEDRDGVFHLITTIRSDFTLLLQQIPKLASLLNKRAERYYLKPIDEKGLCEILLNSMRRANLQWDEPTLPERIVKGAVGESNTLPLVNKLLWLMWQRRVGNVLSAKVYEELGGVGGALARSADDLIKSLGKDGKKRARQLLLRLVKVSNDSQPTRRTISLATAIRAAGGNAEAEAIVRRLSGALNQENLQDARRARLILITTSQQTKKSYVDLAHEALLTRWDTFHSWINQYRDQLFAEEELEDAAQHWLQSGRPRLPGVPCRSLIRRFQHAEAPSELALEYLRAVRLNRLLRLSLLAFLASMLSGFISFGGWINSKGLSVRTGAYLLLAYSGIYYVQPDMVQVPAGKFLMGVPDPVPRSHVSGDDICDYARSISHANESPQHEVIIEQTFYIGKYEVTFDEYDIYAQLNETVEVPTDDGWGRGQRPVISVSWNDAMAYAAWLSQMTGKSYRLPSEAEWEYAARAESTSDYWWGNTMQPDVANCWNCDSVWEGKDTGKKTSPVGSFKANNFGLHDTAGNVWEWVQDCWHRGYLHAPMEGRSWEQDNGGDCNWHVLRGGGWNSDQCEIFSTTRHRSPSDTRNNNMGFRLVRVP